MGVIRCYQTLRPELPSGIIGASKHTIAIAVFSLNSQKWDIRPFYLLFKTSQPARFALSFPEFGMIGNVWYKRSRAVNKQFPFGLTPSQIFCILFYLIFLKPNQKIWRPRKYAWTIGLNTYLPYFFYTMFYTVFIPLLIHFPFLAAAAAVAENIRLHQLFH